MLSNSFDFLKFYKRTILKGFEGELGCGKGCGEEEREMDWRIGMEEGIFVSRKD